MLYQKESEIYGFISWEHMAEVNSQNQSAFIRKLPLDGYAVNVGLIKLVAL